MTRASILLVAAFGIALGGCAISNSAGAATAVDELLAMDRAFSARSLEIGAGPAFVEFAADDVRAFPSGGVTRMGKDELADWTDGWSRDRDVAWVPEEAFASASGDFGYTWGYATFSRTDEIGERAVNHGKYITIWRREPSGAWKWIADMGSSAPPPDER